MNIHENRSQDSTTALVLNVCKTFAAQLYHSIKTFALFNILCVALCVIELLFIIVSVGALAKSSILAISIAILVLTIFSYLVIRLYFQAKKAGQISSIIDQFMKSCLAILPDIQNERERKALVLGKGNAIFSAFLQDYESQVSILPKKIAVFSSLLQNILSYLFFDEILFIREMLLQKAVYKHIEMVKEEPANMQLHASLVDLFFQLADLFKGNRQEDEKEKIWILRMKSSKEMQEKFIQAIQCALEELQVLNHYVSNDAWIHSKKAYCFHALNMPLKEIEEYEQALQITPNEQEALYQLGLVAFTQGLNAKGLIAYETLKPIDPLLAEKLIQNYGPKF